MKYKSMLLLVLTALSFNSFAGMVWTDNDAWGQGVDVADVYLQFQQKRIVFKTSSGTSYSYYWGDTEQMTTNSQTVYSMLLTALSARKNVSVYFDDSESTRPFTLINIHD